MRIVLMFRVLAAVAVSAALLTATVGAQSKAIHTADEMMQTANEVRK